MRWVTVILSACALMLLGCVGTQDQGSGVQRQDCDKLNVTTFAEGFVCPQVSGLSKAGNEARDELLCHHSMFAAFHTAMALCVGLTDNPGVTPATPLAVDPTTP